MTRAVAILAMAALLAACVPHGIVPQQTAIPDNALGLAAAPAPKIADDWWTRFGDPQLDTLMAQALANNPSLGEALARLRAAKAGVGDANAALYPHVDFNGQEERERFSDSYIYPPPYAGTYRWIGTVEADLSWDIDFWGKEQAALDQAKSLQNAARLDAAAARLAVAGAVVQAYVDLDRAYALADIADRDEGLRETTATLTNRRVKDGLDSQVERQEAEALLAQARESKIEADSQRDIVVHELAALIGRGADVYSTIARPALALDTTLPLPGTLPADLLSRRPDLLAARARIDAAMSGRKVAAAAFYPDVDLLATAGWAAIGLAPMLSATSEQFGAGPAVHLPIFDAGKLRADYSAATADLDGAVADYNGRVTGAVRDAADALTRIRTLDGERARHREMLAAAQQGYALARSRYRSGLTNQLTVLNAEDVFFDAQQGDVTLRADDAVQRVTLILALGGGFDPDNPLPPVRAVARNQDIQP